MSKISPRILNSYYYFDRFADLQESVLKDYIYYHNLLLIFQFQKCSYLQDGTSYSPVVHNFGRGQIKFKHGLVSFVTATMS